MKISWQDDPAYNCVCNIIGKQLLLEMMGSPVYLSSQDAVDRIPKKSWLDWISMKLKEVSIQ